MKELHRRRRAVRRTWPFSTGRMRARRSTRRRSPAAGIPYRVRAGAFLQRAAARRLLSLLRRSSSTEVAAEVRRLGRGAGSARGAGRRARRIGARPAAGSRAARRPRRGARRRPADRRRVRDRSSSTGSRDGGEEEGVNLLTYHRAKGLEFEAVFLPRLERERASDPAGEDGRCRRRGAAAALRRSDPREAPPVPDARRAREPIPGRARDRGPARRAHPSRTKRTCRPPSARSRHGAWAARQPDGVPAYVVFHDPTLAEIAERRPASPAELAGVSGVGPAKLERYGSEVLATLAEDS